MLVLYTLRHVYDAVDNTATVSEKDLVEQNIQSDQESVQSVARGLRDGFINLTPSNQEGA